MTFPWETENARRKREDAERIASKAREEALKQYRDAVDRLNRATDQEIDKAMSEILAKQGSGRHLKPLPSNFDQIFRKRGEA